MIARIFATVLAVALIVLAPLAGQAQVQGPGPFGSLSGWYAFPGQEDWRQFDTPFGTSSKAGVGAGWGGRAYGGYRFSGPWDVALGGQYDRTGFGDKSIDLVANAGRERNRRWLVDGEIGYSFAFNGAGIRPFLGLRYLNSRFDVENPVPPLGTQRVEVNFSGIGPRAGIDIVYRFRGTRVMVFGGVSGAALFGHLQERGLSLWSCAQCNKESEIAVNATGQAGLGFELAPRLSLAVGYRIEGWWGNNFAVLDRTGGGQGAGHAGTLSHGPFVRLAYNIGAPAARPAPPPAVQPAPPPAPALVSSFMVFFDFDQSGLTAQARETIAQASASARSGNFQRISVAGHADRSGSEQYNMALSLRRAGAVRDELVRNGVPAGAIFVVGRGETAPLIPTPDGVREAQNRRVEIVLQ